MKSARALHGVCFICLLPVLEAYPADNVIRIGPGVVPPKILHKVEPTYTEEARRARVQGNSLFELVVDENGKPREIAVVSPIGFGLDERAQHAIEQWRFKPGEKDGKPVAIRAAVEVSFRFPEIWFDANEERRRTSYNAALHKLKGSKEHDLRSAIETIQRLSKDKYPQAMYLHGALLREGKLLPQDPEQSLKLLRLAADKNVGPAVYEIGRMYMDGRGFPLDAEKGLKMIHEAAVIGSSGAQSYLGALYEAGKGVPLDRPKARRYFRLCAATGLTACQFRLARLLLSAPDRQERDYVQAIAWLQLATEGGLPEARALLNEAIPGLTPEQTSWVATLKPQLLRPVQ